MISPDDPHVATIVRHLRARYRISVPHLAALAGLTERQLNALLKQRPLRDTMRRRGWSMTTSKALGLPPLERNPFHVLFLVRNAPQQ
jgi:hypothetical protein